MRRGLDRSALLVMILLVGGAAAPAAPGGSEGRPDEAGPVDLLVPVCFYQSYAVGKKSAPTGLLRWVGRGPASTREKFEPLCWPELITSSVAVDGTGRYVMLACGNGVMASRDGGQNWMLTGGWEMAEVQRVAIDRRDPRHLWAATAYGLREARDIFADHPWRPLTPDDRPFFCSDVVQDPRDPETLWVASEEGLFTSADSGRTLERRGPRAAFRRVLIDPATPQHLWAASDGAGLQESRDGGRSWHAVDRLPDVVFSLALSAHDRESVACGTMEGVFLSRDGGTSWQRRSSGLPEGFFVLGLGFDPAVPGRLAAAGTDGLFETRDGGESWTRLGLEGALVRDLLYGTLTRDEIAPASQAPGRLALDEPAAGGGREPGVESQPSDADFERRRELMLDRFTEQFAGRAAGKLGFFGALIAAGEPGGRDRSLQEVGQLLEKPGHSMFYSLPAIGCYLHLGRRLAAGDPQARHGGLPADLEERFRAVLTGTPFYRGDTENHWVMHYTALLLAAQTWPGTSAAEWAMHRDTQSLYEEARGWLVHWARLTATRGQGEFDSPHYMFMYVTSMLLLHDFAREAELRRLAGMTLDLLLADYLSESLAGAYCGGHSRSPGHVVEQTTDNQASGLHYLYAGGIEAPATLHAWLVAAALSDYRPPPELAFIANQRKAAYVQTEVKRVRNVIRYGEVRNPPVFKYDLMTPLCCLGSLQGGILQPIQQHTWDVTWLGGAPNSVLFTVHPFVSGRELGMFFPEEARYLTRSVGYQKGSYVSPDKWVSSSPYEKVFQQGHVLLALYQVPAGERFEHVDLYWPHTLERSEEGGWLFGEDGAFRLACWPCQEGTWSDEGDHDRFRCAGARAGFVVVVGSGDGSAFRQAIVASGEPRLEGGTSAGSGQLTLHYGAPGGSRLELGWGDGWGRVDGLAAEFPSDRLFAGPFIESRLDSGIIVLQGGGSRRVLDFNNFEVTEDREDR